MPSPHSPQQPNPRPPDGRHEAAHLLDELAAAINSPAPVSSLAELAAAYHVQERPLDLARLPREAWDTFIGTRVALPEPIARALDGLPAHLTSAQIDLLILAAERLLGVAFPFFLCAHPLHDNEGGPQPTAFTLLKEE